MALPEKDIIDDAFRMAGLPLGRPTGTNYASWADNTPGELDAAEGMYNDDAVERLAVASGYVDADTPTDPGFLFFFAGNIVEFALNAGYSPLGRNIERIGFSFGELSHDFGSAAESANILSKRAGRLRKQGRIANARG